MDKNNYNEIIVLTIRVDRNGSPHDTVNPLLEKLTIKMVQNKVDYVITP